MRKRTLVIEIDDHCDESFDDIDLEHFKTKLGDMLRRDYDVTITKITVKDANG